MNEYILVLMLEPVLLGQQFVAWPLHITLMPWFEIDVAEEKLAQLLEPIVKEHQALDLTAGEHAWFGPRQTVPVILVHKTAELQILHEAVLNLVHQHHWPLVASQYTGKQFNPHASKRRHTELLPETHLKVKEMYLVKAPIGDRLTRIKTVIAKLPLKGQVNT